MNYNNLIVGDIIRCKEEDPVQCTEEGMPQYMVLYKTDSDHLLHKGKEIYLLNLRHNQVVNFDPTYLKEYEFVGHHPQENEFVDKNGVVLRPTDSFKDPDNNDLETRWVPSITCFSESGEEEISYTQEEFKSDCEVHEEVLDKEVGVIQDLIKKIKASKHSQKYMEKIQSFLK